MDDKSSRIAIIGAGVVGMTVAKILQRDLRNANISILADAFTQDTVSCVAAGIFRPGTSFRGPTKEVTKKWIDESWYFWQDILKTSEAQNAGLMTLSSYIFSKENYHVTRNHLIEKLVPIYRPVDEDELKLCGEGWKYGSYFSTIKIGCEKYLPWVEKSFTENGGKIVRERIDNFASLRSEFDLVFNCTGMGAKALCNDYDLVPLRGQVIKVRVPSLKMAFYGDYDTYVIPGLDGVATLGGVRQYDSYNREVCKHDTAAILERCYELLPFLKKSEIVAEKVGLRPHRVPVRVEPEIIDGVKVVHCYGHGGYGVMCAPGTALDAVKMGCDMLKSNIRSKI
ncbi:D-aspartate oxidase [Vanessa atalanta]|uniref:D-aspartate oxidase n=1 Tax=Vanessa atalanta TaxID=42275 RepID=UPI001FCCDB7B|nr:D-aspartate oxidase [Vanessa atalanta]XP_047531843.1 D-aspartate oxidase [Vanessa atalanta]XP_047531845.1 D-aspartate oxidase [Vanessa atalanta]XP_047531846.1 D-aspartate oxidase [Vanessa atalanta]XP_047531847.1 D-aspartate oxidase [Vanessa atalanta]